MKINGIGPYFSKNIIKYRNKLGGFTNINQLKEIYKMNEKTINLIVKNTSLNPKIISPINLNKDSIKPLIKHPYIQ